MEVRVSRRTGVDPFHRPTVRSASAEGMPSTGSGDGADPSCAPLPTPLWRGQHLLGSASSTRSHFYTLLGAEEALEVSLTVVAHRPHQPQLNQQRQQQHKRCRGWSKECSLHAGTQ